MIQTPSPFEQHWNAQSCAVIRAELDRVAPPGMMVDGVQADRAFLLAAILQRRGNEDVPGLRAGMVTDGLQ